jgi:hypothetical protein
MTASSTPTSRACAVSLRLLAASIVFAGAIADATAAPQLPADVKSWLSRFEQCEHWAGEEPYDKARGKEIDAAFDRLRCQNISADAQKLEQRYKNDPAVLHALEEASKDE